MDWPYILIIIAVVLLLGWFFYYIGTNRFQNKITRFFDRQEEKMVEDLRDQVLKDNPDLKQALDKAEESQNKINELLKTDEVEDPTYMGSVNAFLNMPNPADKKSKRKKKKKP